MAGYENNTQCILDYLALFQALSAKEADAGPCRKQWEAILARERSSHSVQLAPPLLRQQFRLNERDFLLAMAALALEMDGGLRNSFRRSYGLSLPTIEYGLQLISPICPSGCQTLAELAGKNTLCGLLLTTAEPAAYPMERPLILCRTALAFLTGLSTAEIPACTPRIEDGTQWLPLHQEALEQVRAWYGQGAENALYLCAPAGSGRRTLLRRACGSVVELSLVELAELSPPDQDHGLREAAALAVLLLPGAPEVAAAALFLVGLGNGPLFPNFNYLTPKNFGEEASQSVMGTQMAASYVGIMVAPAVCGVLGQWIHMGIFPLYLAAFYLIMLAATRRIKRVLRVTL